MRMRSLLLGGLLLLTGCSSMTDFSWSRLLPFSGFGDRVTITDVGVDNINAGTPITETAIRNGLNHDYHIRSGMTINHNGVFSYYQALKGDTVKMVFTGPLKGHVQRIEIRDPNAKTVWGSGIGTPFHQLFRKAYPACSLNNGDESLGIWCHSEKHPHITYVFQGKWAGSQNIMPPDTTLHDWTVSKIIWQAATP